MNVSIVNYSDITGGAARAAYRIHQALRQDGIESRMLVHDKASDDWTVEGPSGNLAKLVARSRSALASRLGAWAKPGQSAGAALACLPSRWAGRLNSSTADVVHLHWVNAEMMSIADIGRIRKPLVWTLHDMWAFCGAEHYSDDGRWSKRYADDKLRRTRGLDVDRWTWQRKKRHWRTPLQIVTPSRWLAECARSSDLMSGWPVTVIPNPLDTAAWRPIEPRVARDILRLPQDAKLLLFGAVGGSRDPRKGFDLLVAALQQLRRKRTDVQLVVFGQSAPRVAVNLPYPIHYAGRVHDDATLQLLYSAADAVLVPSRLEAFGQTASEAHACGTPVVAFDIGGLPDIVEHGRTGYLAKPYDTDELAAGIEQVLNAASECSSMRHAARNRAETLWSAPVVARQYLAVYKAAMESVSGPCSPP
jgi:glycosyltransferase involved in cell wall biosynthesis